MQSNNKIFLTGASGMVGRNILEHPSASRYSFLTPGSAELDLGDRAKVRQYLGDHKPDLIIHCAAKVGGIQANIQAPVDFLVENIDISRNVIAEAAQVGVPRLINLGSSCMYPRGAVNPLKEELILTGELEPTNEGYAIAKIFAERLCRYLRRQRPELEYKTLIPCNLYGRFDNFSPERSHLVPAVIRKLHEAKLHGADRVEIWGDGNARREFMSAADLADFVYYYIASIANFARAPDLMNVGLGHDHTINEYYRAAATVVGYQGAFFHNLDRPVGMKQKLVDISRQREFGWSPQISLEDGLRHAYGFFLANYENSRSAE